MYVDVFIPKPLPLMLIVSQSNSKGHLDRGATTFGTGGTGPPNFEALGLAMYWSPQILGSTKIQKCLLKIKLKPYYHIGSTTQTHQLSTSH